MARRVTLDDEFSDIAQDAISRASRVDGSSQEYREGLKQIIEEIEVAISASEEMDE